MTPEERGDEPDTDAEIVLDGPVGEVTPEQAGLRVEGRYGAITAMFHDFVGLMLDPTASTTTRLIVAVVLVIIVALIIIGVIGVAYVMRG